jgi:hypothetical protein
MELNSKSIPKVKGPVGKLQPINITRLFLNLGFFRKDYEGGKTRDISRIHEISSRVSLEDSKFSGTPYVQLFNTGPKSARIKAEDGGGAAFAFDLPPSLLEDF